jgi:hypothetical protein
MKQSDLYENRGELQAVSKAQIAGAWVALALGVFWLWLLWPAAMSIVRWRVGQ